MLQRSLSAPEHYRQLESIRDVCPTLNLADVLLLIVWETNGQQTTALCVFLFEKGTVT
ncbi:hypothetical protein DPMN_104471 [Dreissena polymorpha]|uniref:Uncharacterized protein n=1 Tax=Dreissena polymorpha TaxID=45954 RepID=A0A9D4HD78_DREPO|nr:hypothetical protein DPMN_104471 [Dreissena polymorpha]